MQIIVNLSVTSGLKIIDKTETERELRKNYQSKISYNFFLSVNG